MKITVKDYIKANKRAAREIDKHFPHKAHKSIKDYDRKKYRLTVYNYEDQYA